MDSVKQCKLFLEHSQLNTLHFSHVFYVDSLSGYSVHSFDKTFPRRAFAPVAPEFTNINYESKGGCRASVTSACCGFQVDPIPDRRRDDYRARSSGKRLLMIFRVGSACLDLTKGSRPRRTFVFYQRKF